MLTVSRSKKAPSSTDPAPNSEQSQVLPKASEELNLDPQQRREIIDSPYFRGEFYFAAIQKIWLVLLFTLPLDFIFARRFFGELILQELSLPLDSVLLILLLLCFLGLDRSNSLQLAQGLRKLQSKLSESRLWSLVLLGLFVLFTFGEAILKFGQIGIVPVLVVLVLFALGAKRFLKGISDKQAELLALQRDRLSWTLRSNQQIFWIQLLPLAAARLVSIVGVIKAQMSGTSELELHFYTLLSALFLISMQPTRTDFVAACKRCASWTSRALLDFNFCPSCDPNAFNQPPLPQENGQNGPSSGDI